jgi:tungstate transport system ATP-binding protein
MANQMTNQTKWIQLRAIQIVRDGRTILDIPNTDIQFGGITACIGPNGAGKTTFLKLVHGLIKPNVGGSVGYADGIRSALVLHHTPMIKASVRCNIGLNGVRKPTENEIDLVLQEVGLSHLQHQPAHQLSAGEKQKLSLGRARLQNPNLLLLDEPTASLDQTTEQMVINSVISQIGPEQGLVLVTHRLQLLSVVQRVIVMAQGRIVLDGPTADVIAQLTPKRPGPQAVPATAAPAQ